jgi:hypothetical protein
MRLAHFGVHISVIRATDIAPDKQIPVTLEVEYVVREIIASAELGGYED